MTEQIDVHLVFITVHISQESKFQVTETLLRLSVAYITNRSRVIDSRHDRLQVITNLPLPPEVVLLLLASFSNPESGGQIVFGSLGDPEGWWCAELVENEAGKLTDSLHCYRLWSPSSGTSFISAFPVSIPELGLQ